MANFFKKEVGNLISNYKVEVLVSHEEHKLHYSKVLKMGRSSNDSKLSLLVERSRLNLLTNTVNGHKMSRK